MALRTGVVVVLVTAYAAAASAEDFLPLPSPPQKPNLSMLTGVPDCEASALAIKSRTKRATALSRCARELDSYYRQRIKLARARIESYRESLKEHWAGIAQNEAYNFDERLARHNQILVLFEEAEPNGELWDTYRFQYSTYQYRRNSVRDVYCSIHVCVE